MNKVLKKLIIKILTLLKPALIFLFEIESFISKKWVSSAHKRLFYVIWKIPKNPEFFNYDINLYYQWLKSKRSWWVERGVFSTLALRKKGKMLELACGDGFNTKNFYSNISESIVACDFDKKAISAARRKNNSPNINYLLADIRHNMPMGSFDNVVWDAAIEHFTPEEINKVLENIKDRLYEKKGILSGYTIVEREEGKSLEQHEYEFKDMADLRRFFTPYFKNVIVI